MKFLNKLINPIPREYAEPWNINPMYSLFPNDGNQGQKSNPFGSYIPFGGYTPYNPYGLLYGLSAGQNPYREPYMPQGSQQPQLTADQERQNQQTLLDLLASAVGTSGGG